MKKLVTIVVLFISIFCLNNKQLKAQYINIKPEEIIELNDRPLIVQLITEDTYYVEELNKKIDNTKNVKIKEEYSAELESYKNFITDYNKCIKEAITKYWTFNKKKPVEFKTFSDVEVIRKSDPKSYSILIFHQTKLWVRNEYGKEMYANHKIPSLIYSRMEKCNPYDHDFYDKIDYSFYLPYIEMRRNKELLTTDLAMVFRMMQMHIPDIVEKKKKDFKVIDFIRDQADKNCNSVTEQKFLIEDRLLEEKVNKEEIDKVFKGELNIIPSEDISSSIEKNEDYLIGMSIPYNIKADKTGVPGLEKAERIMYTKCFVDIQTGEVFSSYGDKTIEIWEPLFSTKEFKKIGKCK